jgi:hypothetical protein
VYICVISNTTELIGVELIPNLMAADQKTIPSSEEGDKLVSALFHTNSKFLELINQQTEFEHKEQEGLNVSGTHFRRTYESRRTCGT